MRVVSIGMIYIMKLETHTSFMQPGHILSFMILGPGHIVNGGEGAPGLLFNLMGFNVTTENGIFTIDVGSIFHIVLVFCRELRLMFWMQSDLTKHRPKLLLIAYSGKCH